MKLDFTNINTKEQLHAYLAKQLDLPDYYGHNLDALWDELSFHSQSYEITGREELIEKLGEYAIALFQIFDELRSAE